MVRIPVTELFDDEQLLRFEAFVERVPPMPRPLFGETREFPRFVDLPEDLREVALGALGGVKRCELDLDTSEVVYHY